MAFWSRVFGRRRREQELEDEISAHLAIEAQQRIERGESAQEAHSNARRDFGNVVLVKEVTRDVWGWTRLEQLLRDQRYILRQMRRNPGFAFISILTLALGLGATTAIFSIVNSVLLEPMKYAEPGRLYAVVNLSPPRLQANRYWHINARHFHEWRAHCASCESVAMAESIGFLLTGVGEPERLPGLRVSYNFFQTLGVQPAVGRDFRPEEELPGQFHVVILADSVWRSHFGGDPASVGRTLQIDGVPYTVVGVMPPDFRLPVGDQWGPGIAVGTAAQPLMFRPLGQDVSQARGAGNNNFVGVVRLRPGVQASHATAELNSLIGDYVRQFYIELKPALLPLHHTVTRGARAALWLLLGTVGAVWLIVCVNVANLVLVRTAGRDREAGIRMALGSSRGALFRLVLNEALVLVVIGSGLGLLLASAALRVFVARAPIDLPRIGDIQMDTRAWLFAMTLAAVSTLICGFVPAWRLAHRNPQESLKSGSLNASAHSGKVRFRELMVGAEVALSTVLLVVGGLLMMSFMHVMRVPKGFDVAQVITQNVSLGSSKYRDPDRIRFIDDALVRLAAIPDVRAVGMTNQIPLRGETWICDLRDLGSPGKQEVGLANFRFVSPGYWSALGIPLRKGRLLASGDRNRAVAMISERAAQLLWPGQDPIGRRVGACGGELEQVGLEVIGVVGDVRAGLEQEAPLMVYQPYWNTVVSRVSFVLRTHAEPAAMVAAIRTVFRSLDADVPLSPATSMEQVLDEATAVRRFQLNLSVAFAMIALLLASLGIYGVISFNVARRTQEIGIRIALGARAPELMTLIFGQGMAPVFAGLAAGLVGSLMVGQFIASQLYGVTPNDPVTMSGVAILLLIVAAAACWIPARRATRINPLVALRFE